MINIYLYILSIDGNYKNNLKYDINRKSESKNK